MKKAEAPSDAAAFREASLARERVEGQWMMGLGAPVYLVWAAVDASLQPEWFSLFFPLRVLFTVTAVGLVITIRRARSLRAVRMLTGFGFVLGAALISLMLARVQQHYLVYSLGFSIVFWVVGIGTSWPPRQSLTVLGLMLASFGVALVTYDSSRTAEELLGTFFIVGTAVVFAVAASAIRLRLQERAFLASRALAEKNEELSRTLNTLGETQAKLAASEKLSALGRLLAGLSHEINNPINVIQNNLHPLREYTETLTALVGTARGEVPPDGAFARQWKEQEGEFVVKDTAAALGTMATAVQRLGAVHSDLRAFIRGDAPTQERGNLNDGLQTTAKMVSRSLAPEVKLTCELGELPQMLFQPGQLNQVWLNLLQNAIEAVGERGEVHAQTRLVGDQVEVEVRDSGPGIDPAIRARLFEPFMTTKGSGKGTGLGLAVSYQIVKNHQGTIQVEDAVPRGARFIVRLPIQR